MLGIRETGMELEKERYKYIKVLRFGKSPFFPLLGEEPVGRDGEEHQSLAAEIQSLPLSLIKLLGAHGPNL